MAGSGCEILLVDSFSPPSRGGATGLSDLQFVHEVVQRIPGLKVVMIGMEEDADTFLKAVRAGAVGYVLKDASAMDVVAAVRAVAQDEAACPPRLYLSLFKYVSREWNKVPNIRVKVRLGLTRRQQQLIPLVAQGLTNKEIASHLLLSEQTIKNHIHRMMQRVGAEDRLAIVEMVRMQGIFL
jgi:DNA-binding NarL/FixJ family response regulator